MPEKTLIDCKLMSPGCSTGREGEAHPDRAGQRGWAQFWAGRRSVGKDPAAGSREGPERGCRVCGRGLPQGQILPAGLHAALHAPSGGERNNVEFYTVTNIQEYIYSRKKVKCSLCEAAYWSGSLLSGQNIIHHIITPWVVVALSIWTKDPFRNNKCHKLMPN